MWWHGLFRIAKQFPEIKSANQRRHARGNVRRYLDELSSVTTMNGAKSPNNPIPLISVSRRITASVFASCRSPAYGDDFTKISFESPADLFSRATSSR